MHFAINDRGGDTLQQPSDSSSSSSWCFWFPLALVRLLLVSLYLSEPDRRNRRRSLPRFHLQGTSFGSRVASSLTTPVLLVSAWQCRRIDEDGESRERERRESSNSRRWSLTSLYVHSHRKSSSGFPHRMTLPFPRIIRSTRTRTTLCPRRSLAKWRTPPKGRTRWFAPGNLSVESVRVGRGLHF